VHPPIISACYRNKLLRAKYRGKRGVSSVSVFVRPLRPGSEPPVNRAFQLSAAASNNGLGSLETSTFTSRRARVAATNSRRRSRCSASRREAPSAASSRAAARGERPTVGVGYDDPAEGQPLDAMHRGQTQTWFRPILRLVAALPTPDFSSCLKIHVAKIG